MIQRRISWTGLSNPNARRILVEDYLDPETLRVEPPDKRVSYRAFLIRNGGRPMERAILRAEQRYERDKRACTRLRQIRNAYARRTR